MAKNNWAAAAAHEAHKARLRRQENERRDDARRRDTERRDAERAAQAEKTRLANEASAAQREMLRMQLAAERDLAGILAAEERDATAAESEARRKAVAAEKEILGAPATIRTGGTKKNPKGIPVWHWRTVSDSAGVDIGTPPPGYGPLMWLPPGGGVVEDRDTAPAVLLRKAPASAARPTVQHWVDTRVLPAIAETADRYADLLARLRDDTWFAAVSEAVGIAMTTTETRTHTGSFGDPIRQTVTRVAVPTLTEARVARNGLQLIYAHRIGDTAERWSRSLPGLRAAFKNVGVDADALTVAEDRDGNIVLAVNDVDPFVGVPAVVTPYDGARGRSLLGVTASGHEAWITWAGSSGMVVGGVPGSGKTASLLPVFAGMADRAELHVFDGKSGFDLHPLRHIARTYDRTGDIEAPLETLRRLDALRSDRAEALYTRLKANNFWNLTEAQRDELGVTPVFVILDEVQTWLDQSGMDKDEKAITAEIKKLVRALIQKGRSAGIVCVLTTQKPDSTSIPTVIRDNAALKVAFRVSTPEQAVTILGQQPATAPSPTSVPMAAKGRGVMETEGWGIDMFQAAYVDPDALEDLLQDKRPVPDQSAVAARLLGHTPEPEPAPEPAPIPAPEPAPAPAGTGTPAPAPEPTHAPALFVADSRGVVEQTTADAQTDAAWADMIRAEAERIGVTAEPETPAADGRHVFAVGPTYGDDDL